MKLSMTLLIATIILFASCSNQGDPTPPLSGTEIKTSEDQPTRLEALEHERDSLTVILKDVLRDDPLGSVPDSLSFRLEKVENLIMFIRLEQGDDNPELAF